MKAVARASIHLQGRDLRYAEVEQYGARYRLLRLGGCDFDFDVTRELREPDSARLLSVRQALRDVLAGSVASTIRFVLHPPVVRTFFAAVPSDLPKASLAIRAQQETVLLYGVGPAATVDHEIAAQEALPRGDGSVSWQAVSVALPDVRRKLGRLANALPGTDFEVISGRVAAGHALRRFQQVTEKEDDMGIALAIGCYGDQYECSLAAGGQWLFSHSVENMAEVDAAYFCSQVLQRRGHAINEVSRILLYGDVSRAEAPSFARLFGLQPSLFDPLMLVNLDPATIDTDFEGTAYLPCVGGAL
ncbi:MAG: hypothetical protein ACOCSK_00175 [Rhodothermales bacterium]